MSTWFEYADGCFDILRDPVVEIVRSKDPNYPYLIVTKSGQRYKTDTPYQKLKNQIEKIQEKI